MKDRTQGALPVFIALVLACIILTVCGGCASLTPQRAEQIVSSAIAQRAVVEVAKHYGGSEAGAMASAGLHATAEVLQGYIDKKPPLEVAAQSPGVKGVSQVVVDYLRNKGWITQKTVDNLHHAAEIASNATEKHEHTVNDGP